MENVNYSFTNTATDGNLVLRSTVNSFGLEHVTDKDLTSFYTNFSKLAYFDTGLLPVDGSGLLSIRSAGEHTQVAYQHAPGKYYINWGDYEGDRGARKYYVAQPYRIVIADLVNGNILGARTFYSPVPVTYPAIPLYHVNLPNINCRGYRGNGVGWICLYHSEDISQYPFNEKLAKILDRCSGTEAYNDQNMSETDGPRFYRDHDKPQYLWNPLSWEDHTEQHGYEWTLDPDLWIPVLVEGIDAQDCHYENGQQLTFVDALFGNYKAYYTDPLIPKPVNAIARNDCKINSNDLFKYFKQAYNSSFSFFTVINPYNSSEQVRQKLSTVLAPSFEDEDGELEDSDHWYCSSCKDIYSEGEDQTVLNDGSLLCNSCAEESSVYCAHAETHYWNDDENLVVSYLDDEYYDTSIWTKQVSCNNCGYVHIYHPKKCMPSSLLNIWNDGEHYSCTYCASPSEEDGKYTLCTHCETNVPNIYQEKNGELNPFKVHLVKDFNDPLHKLVPCCNACYGKYFIPLAKDIAAITENVRCACSKIVPLKEMQNLNNLSLYPSYYMDFDSTSPNINTAVNYMIADEVFCNQSVFSNNFQKQIPYFRLTHLCPSCINDIAEHSLIEYIETLRKAVPDSIIKLKESGNSIQNYYGFAFYLKEHIINFDDEHMINVDDF